MKIESREVPQKENPARFQLTWVEIPMLAAEDTVGTVTVVVKAVEDMARQHPVRCHVRHQKVGLARTSKDTYLPSALATRARMGI